MFLWQVLIPSVDPEWESEKRHVQVAGTLDNLAKRYYLWYLDRLISPVTGLYNVMKDIPMKKEPAQSLSNYECAICCKKAVLARKCVYERIIDINRLNIQINWQREPNIWDSHVTGRHRWNALVLFPIVSALNLQKMKYNFRLPQWKQ